MYIYVYIYILFLKNEIISMQLFFIISITDVTMKCCMGKKIAQECINNDKTYTSALLKTSIVDKSVSFVEEWKLKKRTEHSWGF